MRLPHISRIFSRLILPFSIFTLLRIIAVITVSASFLIVLTNQNRQHISRTGSLEKAVSAKPSDFNKRLQLALLYEEEFKKTNNRQFLGQALEEAEVALQLNGQNLNTQRLLGRLNAANSAEIKKEIQEVVTIVKNRPDYQAAWLKLAALYEKLGDEVNASNARSRAKLLNGNF